MLTQELVKHLFVVKDGDLLWKNPRARRLKPMSKAGNISKNGYVRVVVGKKSYLAHRLVYFMETGVMPTEIDHINRNKTDNRFCNLREVSRNENALNKGMYKCNTSGYRNVNKHTCGKFEASFRRNGKRIYVGLFDTPEIANAALIKKLAEVAALKAIN